MDVMERLRKVLDRLAVWRRSRDRREERVARLRVQREKAQARARTLRAERDAATPDERAEIEHRLEGVVTEIAQLEVRIERMSRRLAFARARVDTLAKLARRLRNRVRPKIIDLGLTFGGSSSTASALGTLVRTIGHYTAGPKDADDGEAEAIYRGVHASHVAIGYGGAGYHWGITSAGSLVPLRPIRMLGTHTFQNNTGSVGINCPGTTGHTWTPAQLRAYRWLLRHGHTEKVPASHRAPRPLSELAHQVHNQFNATGCPGSYENGYRGG